MAKLTDILCNEFEALGREGLLHAVLIESWGPADMLPACPLGPFGRTYSAKFASPPILARSSIQWRPPEVDTPPAKNDGAWLHVQQYLLANPSDDQSLHRRLHERLIVLCERALPIAPGSPSPWQDPLHGWLDGLFSQESVTWGLMFGDLAIRPGPYVRRVAPGQWHVSDTADAVLRTIASQFCKRQLGVAVDEQLSDIGKLLKRRPGKRQAAGLDQSVYGTVKDIGLASTVLLTQYEDLEIDDGYLPVAHAAAFFVEKNVVDDMDKETARNRINSVIRKKKPLIRSKTTDGKKLVHWGDFQTWLWVQRQKDLDSDG
jgi:hypothetical protein